MNADILIAGGGLAGAAAATALAQAGRAVTLIEREALPTDKICGEFLSTEAQAYLSALGLDPAALGGHAISRLRLIRGRHAIATMLPFQGIGLSRRVLDQALLTHAARAGAKIIRGHAIRAADGASLHIDGLGTLGAENLFLATGKHELRGLKRSAAPPPLVGFKMYFRLAPRQHAELAGHVELIMFRGGYAGLQLVEDGKANFCLLVDRARLGAAGGDFAHLLTSLAEETPHLARRFAGAAALLAAPLAISRIPYGFIHRPNRADPAAVFRLGDQAGVIQSFTGDGMSIALHSAALATRAHLAGRTAADYHAELARHVTGQIRRAGVLLRLASTPGLQPILFAAASAWPAALGLAARVTRVPAQVRV
jgi:flavin-dependent dehydrogenase